MSDTEKQVVSYEEEVVAAHKQRCGVLSKRYPNAFSAVMAAAHGDNATAMGIAADLDGVEHDMFTLVVTAFHVAEQKASPPGQLSAAQVRAIVREETTRAVQIQSMNSAMGLNHWESCKREVGGDK